MDLKKLEIIEKATHVFLKFGIKSVTMDDLARELSTSKKTLYNFFKDKNDLVLQIIQAKILFDQENCISAKTIAENAIDELFKISVHVSNMMKNIHPSVFFDLNKFHPDASKILHEHKWKFVKQSILDNIQRGKNEGIYRTDLNDEIVSTIYVSSTDLISNGEVFANFDMTTDQIFMELIHFQIHGMANEKGIEYLKKYKK
jgi:TetR/AcrR family transcriptional regulator, cholesterol catabolism regulator